MKSQIVLSEYSTIDIPTKRKLVFQNLKRITTDDVLNTLTIVLLLVYNLVYAYIITSSEQKGIFGFDQILPFLNILIAIQLLYFNKIQALIKSGYYDAISMSVLSVITYAPVLIIVYDTSKTVFQLQQAVIRTHWYVACILFGLLLIIVSEVSIGICRKYISNVNFSQFTHSDLFKTTSFLIYKLLFVLFAVIYRLYMLVDNQNSMNIMLDIMYVLIETCLWVILHHLLVSECMIVERFLLGILLVMLMFLVLYQHTLVVPLLNIPVCKVVEKCIHSRWCAVRGFF